MKDLEGKLALVTGGAKGVGKVIVRQLAERGAQVIVNYFHSHDAAKKLKAEMAAEGMEIELIRASVAQKPQVAKMFEEIEAKFGRLDILINNAASGALIPNAEVDEEHFARAFDTNLKGSFWCARHAAKLMGKRGGSIVNISSIGAGLVPANYLVVGTSKAALEALTRYLAVEYARLNIRVNTASATLIEGEVARLFPRYEEMWKASIDHTPMGRLATAEDLAGVVMFLTSEQSRWVTGQTILADGGLSLSSVALSPPPLPEALPEPAATVAEDTAAAPVEAAGGAETEDIAIVGMGLAVPGANDPEEYWRVLMEGPDLFRNVPPDRWDYRSYYSPDASAEDKSYQSRSVFITDFKPEPELGRELAQSGTKYESTTLWLRHSLIQALKGVQRKPEDRFLFAVGYTADGSQHLEEANVLSGAPRTLSAAVERTSAAEAEKRQLFAGIQDTLKARYWRGDGDAWQFLPHNVGLNAMKGVLPENTELVMVDTACSSSLYAADLGLKGLLMGKHDIAVCGGSFSVGPRGSVLFAKLHGLSEGGEVRPLDRKCDGVLFSDGAGVVVLKRLKRAQADGDRILGIVKTCGSSSDGKGKAIYAPSSEGQSIAIARALANPGVDIRNIDWIVAHATGTPAGDLAEFTTLREMIRTDHPVYVTSNKSLIGHTGWAAGVASLIEVVLGLEKKTIPPQHRFTACPAEFAIETTKLEVPTEAVAWLPKSGSARMASISGFGFGGTNAHLVVSEYLPGVSGAPAGERAYGERIAIVGWSAHFPGLENKKAVSEWLGGQGKAPEPSFGDSYPVPPFEKVRMPPPILRSIDRCQLMVLECAHQLKDQLGGFWETHREKTGVLLGHMGATRNATLYAERCYIDDIETALRGEERVAQSPHLNQVLADFRRDTRRMVPVSNENSFPGMMPNVIPARVANYFDLNGLNMTIDTGTASALSAVETAACYLRSLDLDMAVVGGINGNSTLQMRDAVKAQVEGDLAEGAVLFALVREKTAVEAGVPILAYLDDSASANGTTPERTIRCGALPADGSRNYLGAEAAVAILRALHKLDGKTSIACRGARNGPEITLGLQPASSPENAGLKIPAPFVSATEFAPGETAAVSRNVAVLKAFPLEQVRAKTEFFAPGTLILTNMPSLLAEFGELPNGPVVLTTPAGALSGEQAQEAVRAAVARADWPIRHLRVITNLAASAPPEESLYSTPQELVTLHDLTFLALKACFESLSDGGSFVSLYLNSVPGGVLHPLAGMFNGTVKSTALEMRSSLVLSIFTDTADVREAIRQAEIETTAKQYLPTVVHHKGTRRTFFLEPAPEQLTADSPARLGPHSVILATGGARGITAEILKTIARHFQPKLYLIGSNRLDGYPAAIFEGTNEEFAKGRPAYIREQKAAHPEKSLAAVNREYERMVSARTSRQNIAEMERYCGPGKVHYLACDVMDRDAVCGALEGLVQSGETIDLVICAAGLNRSSSIPVKSLADFQAVRDMKLRGYQNIKHALRSRPARAWCNFGSFIGLTGQMGETDYSAGNDLLNTASAYSQQATGTEEFTIGWTLWSTVGLGSHPVFQTFLEKSGLYTRMTTEEGIHHFVREANYASHAASIVYMGPAEKHALTEYIPDFFRDWETRPQQTGAFYLGRELSRTENEVTFERVFDLEKDWYLQHHVVNGYSTLPGTFVTEIAAEAGSALAPGWKVIALEDAVFHHFLRVYDKSRPSPKKIQARIVERREDQVVVQVRVLTDIVGPGGSVLVKDKLHFEMKAACARSIRRRLTGKNGMAWAMWRFPTRTTSHPPRWRSPACSSQRAKRACTRSASMPSTI